MMNIFADSLMIATRLDRDAERRVPAGKRRSGWFRRVRARLHPAA